MFHSSLIVACIAVLGSILSFFNQMLLARFFGAGAEMDSYLLAISLPSFITSLICSAASYHFVPILQRAKSVSGTNMATFHALSRGCGLACGVIAVACSFQAISLIHLLNPALPTDQILVAGKLAKIAWFWLPGAILAAVYSAELHVRQQFAGATFLQQAPSLGSIVICLTMHDRLGIRAIVWGQTLGYVAMLISLHLFLRPVPARPNWSEFRTLVSRVPLAVLSLLVFVMYPFFDAVWGSRIGPSAVSYLGYMQRLLVGLSGMLVVGATTVLFPALAKQAAQNEHNALRANLAFSMRAMLACITPLAAIISVLALPVLQLLFNRGAFQLADARAIASLTPVMFGGMLAMSCTGLLFKALFAQDDLYAAAGLSLGGAILYFFLSGFLGLRFGLIGIGSAYALTWWAVLLAGIARIWRQSIWTVLVRTNTRFAIHLVLNAILVIFVAKVGLQWMPSPVAPENGVRLGVTVGVGIASLAVYLLVGNTLFRLKELNVLLTRLVLPIQQRRSRSHDRK